MLAFLKKPRVYITLLIIVFIVLIIFFIAKPTPQSYQTEIVSSSNLKQEISITGQVKAAESVELSFEKTGKIASVPVKVGDQVKKGQLIAAMVSNDLSANYKQAQASLESARANLQNYLSAVKAQEAKLAEYYKGTRPEEIMIAESAVQSANNDLTNTKNKAEADLKQKLESGVNALADAFSTGLNALFTITDMQNTYFYTNDGEGLTLADNKGYAVEILLGGNNAGKFSKEALNSLTGGTKKLISEAEINTSEINIQKAFFSAKDGLQKTKLAINSIPLNKLSSTDLTAVSTARGYLDTAINTLFTAENAISVQKATNQSLINSAEAGLKNASETLNLKRAGFTTEQIGAQEAQVKSAEATVKVQEAQVRYAEANLSSISAQLEKNRLLSPIDGLITDINLKVGEISNLSGYAIKIISSSEYQIEANIAEVDIANINLNDPAIVTLDAYGPDQIYKATVLKIDPAETFIDGVPTYKTTIQFNEKYPNIKSGMTANVDILTEEKNDIIVIPQRAIIRKDGIKTVRLLENEQTIKEVTVTTGITGNDGKIEITEGLKGGETLIISTKTQ